MASSSAPPPDDAWQAPDRPGPPPGPPRPESVPAPSPAARRRSSDGRGAGNVAQRTQPRPLGDTASAATRVSRSGGNGTGTLGAAGQCAPRPGPRMSLSDSRCSSTTSPSGPTGLAGAQLQGNLSSNLGLGVLPHPIQQLVALGCNHRPDDNAPDRKHRVGGEGFTTPTVRPIRPVPPKPQPPIPVPPEQHCGESELSSV